MELKANIAFSIKFVDKHTINQLSFFVNIIHSLLNILILLKTTNNAIIKWFQFDAYLSVIY